MTNLEAIKNGDVNPEQCFTFDEQIDIKSAFEYPFECFGSEGNWDINSKRFHTCLDEEQLLVKQLLHAKYDKIFYLQEGVNDYHSWYILAKVGEYYIYFEASCDYTGFSCRGGGTFAYSTDWKTLWNMYTTEGFRNLLLAYNNYETINVVDFSCYNDSEYMKNKLEKRKAPEQVVQPIEETVNSSITILERMKDLSEQIKDLDIRKAALAKELLQLTEQLKTLFTK